MDTNKKITVKNTLVLDILSIFIWFYIISRVLRP